MPIERPQSRNPRELDRAAAFGRARYQLRGCKDDRNAAFERWDGVNEVNNSLSQRRQLDAIWQFNGLGKAATLGHGITPQQNRDSSRRRHHQSPRRLINGETKPPLFQGSFAGRGKWFRRARSCSFSARSLQGAPVPKC
jgi:hypothetical protein